MSDDGNRNPFDEPDRAGEPGPYDDEDDPAPLDDADDAAPFREPTPGSLDAGADDPFEQVEVPEVDEEAVWSALDDGGDDGAALDELTDALDTGDEPVEAVVKKNQFCERCEHFSEPPEVACGHEGTEIRELVDVERFRVVDCPVVASRRSLEKTE